MVKVGDRQVFHTERFICPSDETAEITVDFNGAELRIRFSFESSEDDKTPKISRRGFNGNEIDYALINWKNSIADIATPFPVALAGVNGKNLSLAASGSSIGEVHIIFVQFMVEEEGGSNE